MWMLKRVGLFLITNLAVLVVFSIVLYILSAIFGVNLTGRTSNLAMLLVYCAIFGFLGATISLFMSKWSAKKAYNLALLQQEDYSNLSKKEQIVWDTVKDLAERNSIKMPEVGIYKSSEANAFATGATKNSSLVAVSTGLLDLMDADAVEWVVGHEMAHILNGDMVTMTLLQGVVNTFVVFAAKIVANIVEQFVDESIAGTVRFIVDIALQFLFGFLASLVTMWFSRHREYKADAGSAKYVGTEKMVAGLEALKNMQKNIQWKDDRFSTMEISSKKASGFMELFSSHPPLEDRIRALQTTAL